MKKLVSAFLLMFMFISFKTTGFAKKLDLYKGYKVGTLGLVGEEKEFADDVSFFHFGYGNIVQPHTYGNSSKLLVITNKNLDDLIEFTNAYISGNYENDDKVLGTILEWEKKNNFVKVEAGESLEVLQEITTEVNVKILKVRTVDRKKPVSFYMYAKDVTGSMH